MSQALCLPLPDARNKQKGMVSVTGGLGMGASLEHLNSHVRELALDQVQS